MKQTRFIDEESKTKTKVVFSAWNLICYISKNLRRTMAEEESLLTQEEMEAIGLEPDQVS